MWEECIFNDLTIEELLAIVDDATCYGFEFKVENHKIYWREL